MEGNIYTFLVGHSLLSHQEIRYFADFALGNSINLF
jgi:hypothetical protein